MHDEQGGTTERFMIFFLIAGGVAARSRTPQFSLITAPHVMPKPSEVFRKNAKIFRQFSGATEPSQTPHSRVRKSPPREVVRSSAGTDAILPPFGGYSRSITPTGDIGCPPENFRKFEFFRDPSVASGMGLGGHLVIIRGSSSPHGDPRDDARPTWPGPWAFRHRSVWFEARCGRSVCRLHDPSSLRGALPKAIEFASAQNRNIPKKIA